MVCPGKYFLHDFILRFNLIYISSGKKENKSTETQDGLWNEKFQFGNHADLDVDCNTLSIQMWRSKFLADKPLGEVFINREVSENRLFSNLVDHVKAIFAFRTFAWSKIRS